MYEESLKYYRDLKNVVDTAFAEGEAKGKIEGKIEIAQKLKSMGLSINQIQEATGLSGEELENL
jgi:predicted transposase/invertase (TIGR01784 family)